MAPGAGLAYWAMRFEPGQLSDYALPGAAAACRRLASWAQAAELALVAEVAARAAVRDSSVPVGPGGMPAGVPEEAAAEIALALRLSQHGASAWTDLAITLAGRLAETSAALAAGAIDLTKARLIAEATSVLDDRCAKLAQDKVLPAAGAKTPAQLRAALRRAVISVDPDAAERRRHDAERRAKVGLYGDEDGTATLSGQNLPGAHAAAAMARVTALARAMKSAGAIGGIDLLRAQVYIGLLLGTLPLIPPPEDAPPDDLRTTPATPAATPAVMAALIKRVARMTRAIRAATVMLMILARRILMILARPILMNLARPILMNLARPILMNLARPILMNLARPILMNLARPILINLARPILINLARPILINLARPILINLARPILINLSRPILINLARPILINLARPILMNAPGQTARAVPAPTGNAGRAIRHGLNCPYPAKSRPGLPHQAPERSPGYPAALPAPGCCASSSPGGPWPASSPSPASSAALALLPRK